MPYRILVVDDEEQVRELFRDLMRGDEYEAVCVPGGNEALEVIKAQNFDLVLLDIKLVGMNGFDVLKKIKETKPHMAVAMLTGFGYVEELISLSEQYGSAGYLSKNAPVMQIMENIKVFAKAARQKKRKVI
jgi:DNA-binding NtrC family response regulator